MILIELSFFQGHGSSPASSTDLQREPTHMEKFRQFVSHVQSKVKVKKALPEAEEKVYDSKIKLSKKKIKQKVSHVQKSRDRKDEKAPPADEDKHDKSKLTEDEYSMPSEDDFCILSDDDDCILLEPDVTPIVYKNKILSPISEDTKNKGYFYIQLKVCTIKNYFG